MTIFGGVVVFTIAWWMFFFMLLPWGVRRTEEPAEGHDPGAPVNPKLWRKVFVASVLGALATVVINWVVDTYFSGPL